MLSPFSLLSADYPNTPGGVQKGDGSQDAGGFMKMMDQFNKQATMKAAIQDYAAELQEKEAWETEQRREMELAAKQAEESDEFDFEDDDDFTNAFLESRMSELKGKANEQNAWKQMGHGSYNEITEDEFLNTVIKSKYSVCHFYHREFEMCKIMDLHLEKLAKQYIGTKFAKIDSEKTPFFVHKLQVQVIPCVCMFEDGKMVGRLDGLDLLGGSDEFPTVALECVIGASGVIPFTPPEDHAACCHSIFDKQRADIVGLNEATCDSDDDE